MQSLHSTITNILRQTLSGDPFWAKYLRSSKGGTSTYVLHLAVMVEPFLTYMLEGRKTIESRFSQKRIAPFNKINPGDIILLKKAGGQIVAVCLADDTWFYRLDPESWNTIKENFADYICAQDPAFWHEREKAAFATLIKVVRVTPIEPVSIEKRDRRGWVVLTPELQSPVLSLFDSLTKETKSKESTVESIVNNRKHQPTTSGPNSSYCAQGFHVYHRSRRVNIKGYPVCKYCGADIIDWTRIHRRDIAESEYTFTQLAADRLRCDWWTKEIDAPARKHAIKKGVSGLEQAVLNRLTRSVGAAHPAFDGRQTPMAGNAIFYAQHALACCCRKCIECWHGIPRGEALDSATLRYFTELVLKFIKIRIPEIAGQSSEKSAKQHD